MTSLPPIEPCFGLKPFFAAQGRERSGKSRTVDFKNSGELFLSYSWRDVQRL